ncbi:hypothetical protein [Gallaecimonas mangrovi]|uniref:hypothetical protein n=1 Tax=Gallaecimonas mangrovi TaxID=2291597 RepID=UPI000E1FC98A|nr:hypothetical protein [Gallaecimonas mangrovi]
MKLIIYFGCLALFTLILLYLTRDRQNSQAPDGNTAGADDTQTNPALRKIAASMVALTADKDSWDIILKQPAAFLSSGDAIDVAWDMVARQFSLPPLSLVATDNGGLEILFDDVRQPIENFAEEVDPLRAFLDLNRAIEPAYELRYCIDSWHSSDKTFLVMSRNDWQQLEREFGEQKVAYRFHRLGQDVEQFTTAAKDAYQNRYQ